MKKLKIYLVSFIGDELKDFVSAYNSRQARSIYYKELGGQFDGLQFSETEAELWQPNKEDGLYHYFEDENIPTTMTQEEFNILVNSLKEPSFAPV